MRYFSWGRCLAIMLKEFIQMKRDRVTFGMILGLPLLQLIMFGYAINSDPKHLPTAVVTADQSPFTRQLISSMQQTSYFRVLDGNKSTQQAEQLLKRGEIQFALYIPPNFTRDLIRNKKPQVLLEVDGTDPAASSFAIGAIQSLSPLLYQNLAGSLQYLKTPENRIDLVIQPKYNPERITQYNIVPGLLGVVLTMTLVIITAIAITRERERGTMESLLAMPVQPIEVMLGKLTPYILVGYTQVILILIAAYVLFKVPIQGSLTLLLLSCLPFVAANLTVGLAFSTMARNQLQAMQSSVFFFLPSILLSGFMFPFRGMPDWAQWVGNMLPLTHFLIIVRGILLKGNGFFDILWQIEAIILFFIVMLVLGLKRYRQTLD